MSPKAKTVYRCTECGADHPKWAGRCDVCGAWNSLVEEVAVRAVADPRAVAISSTSEFQSPQMSQRPAHFGWSAPQLVQR